MTFSDCPEPSGVSESVHTNTKEHFPYQSERPMGNRLRHFMEEPSGRPEYDEYYQVEAHGDSYIVSLETVLQIERALNRCGEPGWMEFRDLFGARHRMMVRHIYRISESTIEFRAAFRAFERARKKEERDDKDPLEDFDCA